jgi:NitT/TauT family transport system substrate-binding protein
VVANPSAGADLVIKRNDVARKDVELERLEMTLRQNVLTDYVRRNGIGGIDKARMARAIDQIGLTFQFKNKPKPEDVFLDGFVPAETKVQ